MHHLFALHIVPHLFWMVGDILCSLIAAVHHISVLIELAVVSSTAPQEIKS